MYTSMYIFIFTFTLLHLTQYFQIVFQFYVFQYLLYNLQLSLICIIWCLHSKIIISKNFWCMITYIGTESIYLIGSGNSPNIFNLIIPLKKSEQFSFFVYTWHIHKNVWEYVYSIKWKSFIVRFTQTNMYKL